MSPITLTVRLNSRRQRISLNGGQGETMSIINDRGIAVTTPKELGELLRKKRKTQNLTQGQVAEYCGVSVKFISEVERGKETAEIGKVLYLLKMLGIDLVVDTRD